MVSSTGTERKTDRAEAFSDAVLAIAITLPIVDLKAPTPRPGASLARQYADLAPEYGAYALSFVVIGLYWGYSHFSGKLWRKTDHGFNLLTLLFLGCVSLTPFPTRPFIEHVGDPANAHAAATVYAGMLTAPAIAWTLRWLYGVGHRLHDPHLAPDYIATLTWRYGISTAICIAGFMITAWVNWRWGIAIVGLVTLQYMLPPARPRYRPGEEPRDDIAEADDTDR